MKILKKTLVNAQVELDPSLFQKNSLSTLQATPFGVENFIDFLNSNLLTQELRLLYCKMGNELDQRTSSISEMIPDDVWMSVFEHLPQNENFFYYDSFKNVCKRWRNMYSNAHSVAKILISPPTQSVQVSSFGAICELEIDRPFCVPLTFFETIFPQLKTLILSSPEITCSREVAKSDLWTQLTNLKHLEICDFPYPSCVCNYGECHCAARFKYSDFIIQRDLLAKLTCLESLKLGHDPESLRLSWTDFSHFPNILKLRALCFRDYIECEEIFERDAEDKLKGTGKLFWPNGYYDYNRCQWPFLLNRDRYEGDIYYLQLEEKNIESESTFQMHGQGVLYYKESNKYGAVRFEGVFENDREREGVIYFLNGDRYEGKFPKISKSHYKRVGKIIFQNGDVYVGKTKNFKIYRKGILTHKDGQVEKIFTMNNEYL